VSILNYDRIGKDVPEWLSRALDNVSTKLNVQPLPAQPVPPQSREPQAPQSAAAILPPSFRYAGNAPAENAGSAAFNDLPDTQRNQWARIHANQGFNGAPDQSFADTFRQYMTDAERLKREQPQIYNYLRSVVGIEYGKTPQGDIQPNDAIAGSVPFGEQSNYADNIGFKLELSQNNPTFGPSPRDAHGTIGNSYTPPPDPRRFTGQPGAPIRRGR
jgi:hypothetical protein